MDQRDATLTKLAKIISVNTVEQDNGSLNVFIGNGQSLVVGSQVQSLTTLPNQYEATRFEIGYPSGGGNNVEVTGQLSGGSLGGLLNFRSQLLDPSKNALGRVAIGMASAVNTQHRLGMDLKGALGGDMFTVASPQDVLSSQRIGFLLKLCFK